ncbi:MAG: radical SAM protein [Candidatus Omnitrophota bacterium]
MVGSLFKLGKGAMLSWIREFWFYRNLFGAGNIRDAFKDYFLYLFSRSGLKASLLSLNFLITSKCNLKCSLCSFSGSLNSGDNGISVSDFEKFITSIRTKNKPALFFSGGEPFARQDIFDILQIAKQHGFKCGVNTNGTLLDEDKINRLAGLGIELLIFSIYGTQHIHDALTSVKGSYARTLEAVRLACAKKNSKGRVILSCTITRQGLDTLEAIPLVGKSLGVSAVKFEHLNFTSPAEISYAHPHTLLTDAYQAADGFSNKLIKKLTAIRKKYGSFVMVKPDLSNREIKSWYSEEFRTARRCFFAWHSVFIRPDGVVVPCQFLLDHELGDIKKQGPEEITNNGKIFALRRSLGRALLPECSRCCKL